MYLFQQPRHPVLRSHIDNYWCLILDQFGPPEFREQIFADGQADIIFNFGVSYQRNGIDNQMVQETNLDAQRAYPVLISQTGSIHLIGVRFRRGALRTFLGNRPLQELTGAVINLGDIFGADGRVLENRLFDLKRNFNTQVDVLDAFFLKRYRPTAQENILNEIGTKLISQPIYQVSRETGYSERTLHRQITQQTGFSPNLYARILRFQRALFLLSKPNLTLSGIAHQCGYYDQAHFSKDFKEFAGISPSNFRSRHDRDSRG